MKKITLYWLAAALSLPAAALAQDSSAYSRCLNQAETTVAMRDCNAEEIAIHDQRLNTAYRALRARMNTREQQQLRRQQRQWIRQRDQKVRAAIRAAGNGTAALLEGDSVYLQQTRQRADQLEVLLARRR